MAMWSTCGQGGYITLAVLGVPNTQHTDKSQKWLSGPHVGKVPAVLGLPNAQRGDKKLKWLCGPHVGKPATSPLLSWGFKALSAETKSSNWLSGPHVGKVATSSERGT